MTDALWLACVSVLYDRFEEVVDGICTRYVKETLSFRALIQIRTVYDIIYHGLRIRNPVLVSFRSFWIHAISYFKDKNDALGSDNMSNGSYEISFPRKASVLPYWHCAFVDWCKSSLLSL